MRSPRPSADVWNHEVDDKVIKDVVIGVGKLDQHPVQAGRQVLDDDGVRPVPRQIVNGNTKGSDARRNRERRWTGVLPWAAVAHASV